MNAPAAPPVVSPAAPLASWQHQAARRFLTLMGAKAGSNTVFLLGFFWLYLYLQQHPQFAVTQIAATPLDRWIGFQPWAIWPYLSLWLYTTLPVALHADVRALTRHGLRIGALCACGLLIFWLWPTSVSGAVGQRPGSDGLFAVLYAVDSNGNALPSLHVAAAVFSGALLAAQLRAIGAPRWVHALNALWGLAIVYATLATKQHLLWDVLAGLALGLAFVPPAAWRRSTPRPPSPKAAR